MWYVNYILICKRTLKKNLFSHRVTFIGTEVRIWLHLFGATIQHIPGSSHFLTCSLFIHASCELLSFGFSLDEILKLIIK